MDEGFLRYYRHELRFLEETGKTFAEAHPDEAGHVWRESEVRTDPHVERLIQAFAFLSAGLRQKIDDDFPAISEALLNVVYPHFLAPLPSMAIVQFSPQRDSTSLQDIKRGTLLTCAAENAEEYCFETCYPVSVPPLEIASAGWVAPATVNAPSEVKSVIRIELRCFDGVALPEVVPDSLRLYLDGEFGSTFPLYELLLNNVIDVQLRNLPSEPQERQVSIGAALSPVAFAESMLPYSDRSFRGYQLLQEYFAFPWKFLFVDVPGLRPAAAEGFTKGFVVLIFLRQAQLAWPLARDSLRLACTPIINLFGEEIQRPLNPTRVECLVEPSRTGAEIYQIDEVRGIRKDLTHEALAPMYSARHAQSAGKRRPYWYARREAASDSNQRASQTWLTVVDAPEDIEKLTIDATCTNGTRIGALQGNPRFRFESRSYPAEIRCLKTPTPTVQPYVRPARPEEPIGRPHWRLISHLSLNYLSLAANAESLRALLSTYNLSSLSEQMQSQIEGIVGSSSTPDIARHPQGGFCRGQKITVQFDEAKYPGQSVYLFASIIERFLAMYASINSFTLLVAQDKQGDILHFQCQPRAGERPLL
jgi:type VI secretion system protein ImpG